MGQKKDEIELLVEELRFMAEHPDDGRVQGRFAENHALRVAELLEELRLWRENEEKKAQGTQRITVEGFSEEDIHDAFSQALAKAMKYMSEEHDTAISVVGLQSLPHGGHHATLEIIVTPIALKLHAHVQGLDVEVKRAQDHEYRQRKAKAEVRTRELVNSHFLEISGGVRDVPDFFMININDADLLNFMIEKDFFKAGQGLEIKHDNEDVPPPVPHDFANAPRLEHDK